MLRDYYLAEGLRILVSNTANAIGGSTITKSLADLSKPQKKETRTAGEIISKISAILEQSKEQ